ncbi:Calx-beta domain-containing protein [Planctomycetota bacterium]
MSLLVPGLPTDGRTLYVRLYSDVPGQGWLSNDYTFVAHTATANFASLQNLTDGQTLPKTPVTFEWDDFPGAELYWLEIGTQEGGKDLLNLGVAGTSTEAILPSDGSDVYVRLWTKLGGSWGQNYNEYTFTTFFASKAELVYAAMPLLGGATNGATLTSWNDLYIEWNPSGADAYWVYVGSAPGLWNFHDSGEITATWTTALQGSLPKDGSTIYVTLYSKIGTWQANGYSFVSFTAAPAQPAALQFAPGSPGMTAHAQGVTATDGSTLKSTSLYLEWNDEPDADKYWLYVGSAAGARDFADLEVTGTNTTVTGLAADGSSVYVTLFSRLVDQGWQTNAYSFVTKVIVEEAAELDFGAMTAASGTDFVGDAAVNGATLKENATLDLIWEDKSAALYWVYVGTVPGGANVWDSGAATYTSSIAAGEAAGITCPQDGSTLYVTIYTKFGGPWMTATATFVAFVTAPPTAAQLNLTNMAAHADGIVDAADGSTLKSNARKLYVEWTDTLADKYWLYVGSSAGGANFLDQDMGSATNTTVTGLPTDGSDIYVTLYSKIGASWPTTDYAFVAYDAPAPSVSELDFTAMSALYAADFAALPATNGSVLTTGAALDLIWEDNGAISYWVYVGTAPRAGDLWNSGSITATGSVAAGEGAGITVPQNGSTIYVSVYATFGAGWLLSEHTFTAYSAPAAVKAALDFGAMEAAEFAGGVRADGGGLTSNQLTLRWDPDEADQYWIYVGTGATGTNNLGEADAATNTQWVLSGLPVTGETIYVRLMSKLDGVWGAFNDYSFVTFSATAATLELGSMAGVGNGIVAASDGSTLADDLNGELYVEWTDESAPLYWLKVGSTAGGFNYHNASSTGTNVTVTGLPLDGSPIHVTIMTKLGGAWSENAYAFVAAAFVAPNPAVLNFAVMGADFEGAAEDGGQLNSSELNLVWAHVAGIDNYWVYAGTGATGTNNLEDVTGGDDTGPYSVQLTGLPLDGTTIYVRLMSKIGGVWGNNYNDYSFVTFTATKTTLDLAAMAADNVPETGTGIGAAAEGSTLVNSSGQLTVRWEDKSAPQYWLKVGSTPGGFDYHNASSTSTSELVTGIAIDGSAVYVTIQTKIGVTWPSNSYSFVAYALVVPNPAELDFSAMVSDFEAGQNQDGGELKSSNLNLAWTHDAGIEKYWIYVGTGATGTSNLVDADGGDGADPTHQITGLPSDGTTIYVRLMSKIGGVWGDNYNDYTFVCNTLVKSWLRFDQMIGGEFDPAVATTDNPLAGTQLTLKYENTGAEVYWVGVGLAPGGTDFHGATSTAAGAFGEVVVTGLPEDGTTLYVSLQTQIPPGWESNEYTFTAYAPAPKVAAQLTSPVDEVAAPGVGYTLSSSVLVLEWNDAQADEYWIYVGTATGSNNLYDESAGTNLTETIPDMPIDGSDIYVRLMSKLDGVWGDNYHDYIFVSHTLEAATLTLTTMALHADGIEDAADGSTLKSATGSLALYWNDTGAAKYWLKIGSAPGGTGFANQDMATNTSALITGIATDGRTLHVTLQTKSGATWLDSPYTFVAFEPPVPDPGTLTAPYSATSGETLQYSHYTNNSQVLLEWTDPNDPDAVEEYYLYVGTKLEGTDIWQGSMGTDTSKLISNVPMNGTSMFVRLYSKFTTTAGVRWPYVDYEFTTHTPSAATIVQADLDNMFADTTNGIWAAVAGTSMRSDTGGFYVEWTPPAGETPDQYLVNVGTTPGGKQLIDYSAATNTSATFAGLPVIRPGDPDLVFYVRIYTRFASTELFYDTQFKAAIFYPPVRAVLDWDTMTAAGDGVTATDGSTLVSTTGVFKLTWEHLSGDPAAQYWVYIGDAPGGSNLENSGAIDYPTMEWTADPAVPIDGRTIYVRLMTKITGEGWPYYDYTFTTWAPTAPDFVSPTPGQGSTLTSSAPSTFEWNDINTVTAAEYWLTIGSGLGKTDIHNGSAGTSTQVVVSNLPTDGRLVYARIGSKYTSPQGNKWYYPDTDRSFNAWFDDTQQPTLLNLPIDPGAPYPLVATNGDTLPKDEITFTWETRPTADDYSVYVGTTPGGSDINSVVKTTNTSWTCTNLPSDGNVVHVWLYARYGANWQLTAYWFTAFSYPKALITNPVADPYAMPGPPGAGDPTSLLVEWSDVADADADQYNVVLGTSDGATDLWDEFIATGTLETTITGIPKNGATLYLRVYTQYQGEWNYDSRTVAAFVIIPATIFAPVPGTECPSRDTTFLWLDRGSSEYYVKCGLTDGGTDFHDASVGTNTQVTISGLPTNAQRLYFEIWTRDHAEVYQTRQHLFDSPGYRLEFVDMHIHETDDSVAGKDLVVRLDMPQQVPGYPECGGVDDLPSTATVAITGYPAADTATLWVDYWYWPTTETVTFEPGSLHNDEKTFKVYSMTDELIEVANGEKFGMVLQDPTGPVIVGDNYQTDVVIDDDEGARIKFKRANSTVAEGATTEQYILEYRTFPLGTEVLDFPQVVRVDYRGFGVLQATYSADYTIVGDPATFTIPASIASADYDVYVDVLDDDLIEGDEQVELYLTRTAGTELDVDDNTHVLTIDDTDDEQTSNANVEFQSASSGAADIGWHNVVFVLNTDGGRLLQRSLQVGFDYDTGNSEASIGTAFGEDVQTWNNAVFPALSPNGATATLQLYFNDTNTLVVEGPETLDLFISGTGVADEGAQGGHEVTITDAHWAEVEFQYTVDTRGEDSTLFHRVRLNTNSAQLQYPVTVVVEPQGTPGPAGLDTDYSLVSPLAFSVGDGNGQLYPVFTPISDSLVEADEAANLTLGAVTGPAIATGYTNSVITVNDADYATFSFGANPSPVTESSANVAIPVVLITSDSGTALLTAPVQATVSDTPGDGGGLRDAQAGNVDYGAVFQPTVTWSAGSAGGTQSTAQFDPDIDNKLEGAEYLRLNVALAAANGQDIRAGTVLQHLVQITDANSAVVRFHTTSSSVVEAETTHNIAVQLDSVASAVLVADLVVNFTATEAMASAPEDYEITSLTIPTGMGGQPWIQNWTVTIHDDDLYEAHAGGDNETETFTISSLSGAGAVSVVTIDTADNVHKHTMTVTEDDSLHVTGSQYNDVNISTTVDQGDTLVLTFNGDVTGHRATTPTPSPASFYLPVQGDFLGNSPSFADGPGADQYTVTLGATPTITPGGTFTYSTGGTDSASPSGIDINAGGADDFESPHGSFADAAALFHTDTTWVLDFDGSGPGTGAGIVREDYVEDGFRISTGTNLLSLDQINNLPYNGAEAFFTVGAGVEYEQQITATASGTLKGVYLTINTPGTFQVHVTVASPPVVAPFWTSATLLTTTVWQNTLQYVDLSAAGITLSEGTVFTIGIVGVDGNLVLAGTQTSDFYPGGDLYEDGALLTGNEDLRFMTFVLTDLATVDLATVDHNSPPGSSVSASTDALYWEGGARTVKLSRVGGDPFRLVSFKAARPWGLPYGLLRVTGVPKGGAAPYRITLHNLPAPNDSSNADCALYADITNPVVTVPMPGSGLFPKWRSLEYVTFLIGDGCASAVLDDITLDDEQRTTTVDVGQ